MRIPFAQTPENRNEILVELGAISSSTFNKEKGALAQKLGISGKEVYDMWRNAKRALAPQAKAAPALISSFDVEQQFRDAAEGRGLILPLKLAYGQIERCSVEGKPHSKNGAYLFYSDGVPSGGFQNWTDGHGWEDWRADIGRQFTEAELMMHRKRAEEAQRQREMENARRQSEAREEAARILAEATPDDENHPYLQRKQVGAHGLKMDADGALLIPLHDTSGTLHSIQRIYANGGKYFLEGGRKTGCFHLIGGIDPTGDILIGEGYATMASAHEATGKPTVIAFDSGNLLPVAKALRRKYPSAKIVVCADDDWKTEINGAPVNTGVLSATKAAEAVNGVVVKPDFGADRPDWATDFNDMHALHGREAVRACFEDEKIPEKAGQGTIKTPETPVLTVLMVERPHTFEKNDDNTWGVPQPIDAPLYPVPALDAGVLLPDGLRDWVTDTADRMPCAFDYVANAALVAAGAVIGAHCVIMPKKQDDWAVVPNLWGGVVGAPSEKKSPAIGEGMKPLERLASKALNAHQKEMEKFGVSKIVHEAHRNAIETNIKAAANGKGKGKTVDDLATELMAHNSEGNDEPKARRYKTNDATVEKLGEILRDNPNGILVLRDELVGLLASWDKEGREGDRAFFLEAWNGNSQFDTDRITRGSILIPNLCASVFGGIQPDKLTGYLEQAANSLANDGMLQRFQLLVYPDPVKWEYRDRHPDQKARDRAYSVFDRLADFDPVAWGASPAEESGKFPFFRFSPAAQEVFIDWSRGLHRRIEAEDNPLIAQHLAKYDKLFPALALILHLIDIADGGSPGPVTEMAALRAAAWCEYLEAHARRCYGLLADEGLRAAQMLASKLRVGALDDGFTARNVRMKGWRYLGKIEAVEGACEWLEDAGWLRAEPTTPTERGGRPTVRYRINPALKVGAR
jgi:phage/plasmid primase-like uncharacterized protein